MADFADSGTKTQTAEQCPVGEKDCPIIDQVRELRDEVKHLGREVRTDALTGLFNYRHFSDLLDLEVERAKRSGLPLALIIVDLDHFKRLNDGFGHEAGNLALRRVADELRLGVRKIDTVCRYGGEELVILLPGARLPMAVRVAERLRSGIEQLALEWQGETMRVTASLGVAVLPSSGASDGASLVRAADELLYQAKAQGRNRVEHPALIAEQPETQVTQDEKQALLK